MGKRILIAVAVASLLTIAATGCRGLGQSADDIARSADDVARSVDDAVRDGGRIVRDKPASFPKPDIAHPVPAPDSIEIPPAVKSWTDDLSTEDAKTVIGVACKLSEVMPTDADIDQWAFEHGDSYGEDQLTALVGLAKEMRGNAGVKVVCKAAG
jgi:hypothetical protein